MAIDVVQEQLHELSTKVDLLHSTMKQLVEQVSAIATAQKKSALEGSSARNGRVSGSDASDPPPVISAARTSMNMAMNHKDILSDENYIEGDKKSATSSLSPEVQVQRLTAQLTAAYNRMAVLEEQILACRFH